MRLWRARRLRLSRHQSECRRSRQSCRRRQPAEPHRGVRRVRHHRPHAQKRQTQRVASDGVAEHHRRRADGSRLRRLHQGREHQRGCRQCDPAPPARAPRLRRIRQFGRLGRYQGQFENVIVDHISTSWATDENLTHQLEQCDGAVFHRRRGSGLLQPRAEPLPPLRRVAVRLANAQRTHDDSSHHLRA
jgi:hypothetical protein